MAFPLARRVRRRSPSVNVPIRRYRKDPNLQTPSIRKRKNMVEIEESLHFDRCPDEFSWKSRSTTMPCTLPPWPHSSTLSSSLASLPPSPLPSPLAPPPPSSRNASASDSTTRGSLRSQSRLTHRARCTRGSGYRRRWSVFFFFLRDLVGDESGLGSGLCVRRRS